MKIQQITQSESAEPKIAEQLPTVHGQDGLDNLQLDNHAIGNEQVDPIAIIDNQVLVTQRQQNLPTDGYFSLSNS